MKKIITAVLIIVIAAIAATSIITLLVVMQKSTMSVTVSGEGKVTVKPDTAYVRLGVEVLRKTAQRAQTSNAYYMQQVVSAIQKQGIDKEAIQTSNFNIWPEIKYGSDQSARTVGYRCSNQITVTLDDISKVSKVIDAAIGAGSTTIQGVSFTRKDVLQAKKDALDKAMKEAQAKADSISASSGEKIVGIKNVFENGANIPGPMANDMAFRVMGAASTPISPSDIDVSANIIVTYELEKRF